MIINARLIKLLKMGTVPVIVLLIILVIIIAIRLCIIELNQTCKWRHCPPISELIKTVQITRNGDFINKEARAIAQLIYEYRSRFVYDYTMKNNYINVFKVRSPNVPYKIDELSDMALYRLSTCTGAEFSKMMAFAYVYNNARFIECINAYNTQTRTFGSIDLKRSTRDIIIKDILHFGDASINDLKLAIESEAKRMNLNTGISSKLIESVVNSLNAMTDEQLYNLINHGLIE